MCENHYFVVPVNILTPFAHAPFSWTAQHTMCLYPNICNLSFFTAPTGQLQVYPPSLLPHIMLGGHGLHGGMGDKIFINVYKYNNKMLIMISCVISIPLQLLPSSSSS